MKKLVVKSVFVELDQGSHEWISLRKSKITATDAPIIIGASKWKTRSQLLYEKLDPFFSTKVNDRMKRGIELEPIARNVFTVMTGIHVEPKVFVKDWAMASLDGISEDGKVIVEIKCPGFSDHSLAKNGVVPRHYYPQLQHQLFVCDVYKAFYFSFDGKEGVAVEVLRDDDFIEKMVIEEEKFYNELQSKKASIC